MNIFLGILAVTNLAVMVGSFDKVTKKYSTYGFIAVVAALVVTTVFKMIL